MHKSQRIEIATHITHQSVQRLLSDDITALIIEGFYPAEHASVIADKLIQSETLAHYTHEVATANGLKQEYLGVDRVGIPFNLIYDKPDGDQLVDHYYAAAKENIARIRSYANCAMTPIDKLRLELDENYAEGAMIADYQNKKMLAGIGRVSHAEMSHMSEDPPHFDALPKRFADLTGQFAANIYLKVPDRGGELEMWDVEPLTPLSSVPDNWRAALPDSITIKPYIGDLIIFNCRRPHAIRRFTGEPRVTMQVFIGHKEHQPLKLWN